MSRLASGAVSLVVWSAVIAAPATAQHGEVQLGALVSYGVADSFREGAGAVAGVALGRLAYVGMRWVYQAGGTDNSVATTTRVTNRTQLFMADLGLMVPVGGIEIVPGVGLGAVRFTQHDPVAAHATEFVVAPGLCLHIHLFGVVAIPEVQYLLAGEPDLRWPPAHRGVVAALRVVIPFEVRRIRY